MSDYLQEVRFDKQTKSVINTWCIRSDHLNPFQISDELGISPSWSYAKGEEYAGRMLNPETKELVYVIRKRPCGVWAINSTSLYDSLDVNKHLLYLLDILEPKVTFLKKYLKQSKSFQIGFTIKWSPFDGWGSYEISSDLLLRMARLSHYTEFSFWGSEEG